jgi:pimeloyl-ACP methyl ester carboxylesterase
MTVVDVEENVEIYVQDVGSGSPVVLLAGFGLDHDVWDRQTRVLGGEHRVIAIDLRGTGRSSKPYGGYELDRLAADVECVLDRLGVSGAALVGWSFGGQVAFRLAATVRFARLVLVSSGGVRASRSDGFPFGRAPDELERALVAGELSDRIAARRRTLRGGFHREPSEATLDFLTRIFLRMPSWAALACYHTYLHSDLTELIPHVTLPTLQIVGSDDPVHGADGAGWLSERLTNARVEVLSDCGHYPMFEAADDLDAALIAFLRAA